MAIITHNMTAMNTERHLEVSSKEKKKSTERLSSGYRINRSADDAAGLQISEKMRITVRGLNKASRNIQDGNSMIQAADGALMEVHDILQRMNELSTQAANDTNAGEDREAIHKELNQLKSEINRTSRETKFNTHPILRVKQLVEINVDDYGNIILDDQYHGIGSAGNVYGKTLDFTNVTAHNKEELIGKKFTVTCSDNCTQKFTFQFSDKTNSTISNPTSGHSNLNVDIGIKDTDLKSGADIVNKIFDLVKTVQGTIGGNPADTHIGHANGISTDGAKMIFYSIHGGPPYNPNMGMVLASDMLRLEEDYHIQVSDRPYQEITLKLRTINSETLGLGKMDVDSFENAGKTMEEVQTAIDNLSEYRAYLGSMQNRLEKAMSSVENTAENTQRSESKLRDADMAEEMVRFSKNKILEQFGEVMLAQTSQSNENVTALLA